MKVFFHAYLRSPENFFDLYKKIFHTISELGYQEVSDFIMKVDPQKYLDSFDKAGHEKRISLYANFIRAIKEADILVADISMHSLSSGFLIHEALDNGKPVIALFHEGHDPVYILNMNDEKLQFVEYNLSNLKDRLGKALETARKQVDVRFNFFIPPEIINYLNWLSAEKRISKSTYIRNIIMKDMEKNKDYKKLNKKNSSF